MRLHEYVTKKINKIKNPHASEEDLQFTLQLWVDFFADYFPILIFGISSTMLFAKSVTSFVALQPTANTVLHPVSERIIKRPRKEY